VYSDQQLLRVLYEFVQQLPAAYFTKCWQLLCVSLTAAIAADKKRCHIGGLNLQLAA
jgi:hypothetical protein